MNNISYVYSPRCALCKGCNVLKLQCVYGCFDQTQRAARRRRPVRPSATGQFNVVELSGTKKIRIIFFGIAAGAATPKKLLNKKAPQKGKNLNDLMRNLLIENLLNQKCDVLRCCRFVMISFCKNKPGVNTKMVLFKAFSC